MRKSIFTILLFISAFSCFAEDEVMASANEAFQAGNDAYKNGDYAAALKQYIAADSLVDGLALNFNLGNTWFKLKKFPESILYYERALKYEPGNEDVRYNLRLANDRIVDRIETLPKSKINIWWDDFRYGIGPDGWAYISLGFIALTVLCFLLYWMARTSSMKKFGFFAGIALLLLTIAAHTVAQTAQKHRHTYISAVVFTDKVDIKSEPRDVATNVFVLHAGTKVFILTEDENWYEIEIASGNRGWLKKSEVREI